MLTDIFVALWFFLPAGAANVAPIIAAKMPGITQWTAPLDFGKTWGGQRIFGSHKTWRGLATGILVATAVLFLQQLLVENLTWLHDLTKQIDYSALPVLVLGPLFAVGALGADAIKSFFKRRVGVAPGRSWFPFDQADYVLGAILVTLPFVVLTIWQYVWLVVILAGASLVASYIGYRLRLKERPI